MPESSSSYDNKRIEVRWGEIPFGRKEAPMEGKYFDDFNIGDKFVSPAKTVTEATIDVLVGLGGCTFPLFSDEEYAKTTEFKGRVAPGTVTLLIMLGLEEQTGILHYTSIAALGLDKVRFLKPLRAGDTIRCETEIIDKRETGRADGAGIIIHKDICVNQKGEVILQLENKHLMKRKP